jgi:hypothetical protein
VLGTRLATGRGNLCRIDKKNASENNIQHTGTIISLKVC